MNGEGNMNGYDQYNNDESAFNGDMSQSDFNNT